MSWVVSCIYLGLTVLLEVLRPGLNLDWVAEYGSYSGITKKLEPVEIPYCKGKDPKEHKYILGEFEEH